MFHKQRHMKLNTIFVLGLLMFIFKAKSQTTDYTKVVFNSQIYEYKKDEPRTHELGVNKTLVTDIVDLLSGSQYNEEQKKEIINKTWLAFTNPKLFDFIYKDFAENTIDSWGYKNAKGKMVLEPNPYLTEWTITDEEFQYFQIALKEILTHFSLISYGEDAEGVNSSFNELLMTKAIEFKYPSDDDWAYSYLETVNIELEKQGLIALITKGHYDIIVCEFDKKDEITNLFQKIQWDFIQP